MKVKKLVSLMLALILTMTLFPAAGALAADDSAEATESHVSDIDFSHIDTIVDKYSKIAEYSVAVVDLNTGKIVGSRNMSKKMSASTMIAFPILFTTDKRIDAGDINLDRKVEFKYIMKGGKGELYKANNGSHYSLERLLKAMLRSGDCNAANSVMDFITRKAINTFCKADGFEKVSINYYIGKTTAKKDNFVSAKDLCGIINSLYGSDSELGHDFLVKNLTVNSEKKNTGLGRHLEDKVDVLMNYYGVTTRKYNNVSIVENGSTAYAVVWLSNSENHVILEEIASNVGDYVFDQMCGEAAAA